MPRPYIDFISADCDRWCERCAFTARCSNFAVSSALAMCDGNFEAAIELAIGPPRVPGGQPQQPLHERMAEALEGFEPTEKELEEVGREMDARRARIEKLAVAEASHDYAIAAHRWLRQYRDTCGASDGGEGRGHLHRSQRARVARHRRDDRQRGGGRPRSQPRHARSADEQGIPAGHGVPPAGLRRGRTEQRRSLINCAWAQSPLTVG
jgi:hypothetical protein